MPPRKARLGLVHRATLATSLLFVIFCLPVSAQGRQDDRADPVSTSLIIINGFLVFFMQVGFLSYETGSGRAKNVRNILLKNLLDVMLAAIVWWAVGYAFAYGKSAGGVIGTNLFFYEGGSTFDRSTRPWFFSWTFCIASCTIISGCLAERTALAAYPVATLLISGLVHPLLVHWLWSPSGWISHFCECQVLDFAGGMVVHMLGGLFGLVGAWKCGPRLGRFELVDSSDYDDEGAAAQTVDSASDLVLGEIATAAAEGDASSADAAVMGSSRRSWDPAMLAAAAEAASSSSAAGHSTPLPSAPAWALGLSSQPGSGGWPGGARVAPAQGTAAGNGTQHETIKASGLGWNDSGVLRPQIASASAAAAAGPAAASTAAAGGSSQPELQGSGIGNTIRHKLAQVRALRLSSPLAGQQGAAVSTAAALHARRLKKQGKCGLCHYMPKPMPGHDMAFVTLGTFMLWFGWFGFNNGSVYMYVSGNTQTASSAGMANMVSAEVVQRTSMNTALGGSSGGLMALLVAAVFSGTYDLRVCCNGVLSGLVTVTCMCGFVDPWAAVVCSGIAGALYTGMSCLLLRCGIDDPLDSSAVHLGNGLLGTIMLAFVAKPDHVLALTGSPCGGIFYSSTGWLQLGLQLLAVLVVIVFAGGTAWIMFALLDHYMLLRVDQVTELAGIDNMDHGGPAYPEFTSNSIVAAGSGQNAASAGRRMLQ